MSTLRLLDELAPEQIGARLDAIFRAKLAALDHDWRFCSCADCRTHRQQFETQQETATT